MTVSLRRSFPRLGCLLMRRWETFGELPRPPSPDAFSTGCIRDRTPFVTHVLRREEGNFRLKDKPVWSGEGGKANSA